MNPMGLVGRLRRWISGGDEPATAGKNPDETDGKTTIEDAEATSLRAIKLPDAERDALDADEREP